MAKKRKKAKVQDRRKKRTRERVIADQSLDDAATEREAKGEEAFAIVSVFLECESGIDDLRALVHPQVGRSMVDEARRLADEMFRGRHPDAVTEHAGGDDE